MNNADKCPKVTQNKQGKFREYILWSCKQKLLLVVLNR